MENVVFDGVVNRNAKQVISLISFFGNAPLETKTKVAGKFKQTNLLFDPLKL